ncbi:MAG: HD domain-containing protein [Geobacteraceae bacterium]|nr:HD domain-containing protein [Geobacteraceae bacterium]
MNDSGTRKTGNALVVFIFIALALVLTLSSLYSYNLFHSMAELFCIIIAASIFVIAWNTRKLSTNPYLLFIGISYLFVAFLDLIHTLSYKGMGVFEISGANLPTQIWIAGRYLQGISLLAAPFFIDRKLKAVPVFIVYSSITLTLLLLIFSGLFPDAYVTGSGLTTFKVTSEYVVSLVIAAAIVFLWRKKEYFDRPILILLTWSFISAIAVEMSFTLYTDVYGYSNLLGHLFKIASYYLIYAAIVKTNLKKPYESLTMEIEHRKKFEEELRLSNTKLIDLYNASSRLNTIGTCEYIYNNICDGAFRLFELRMAWIGLIQPGSIHVEPIASAGFDVDYLTSVRFTWGDELIGRGPAGVAIRSQSPCCMDVEHHDFLPWREGAVKRGFKEVLGLPLTVGGHCLGVLVMCSSESGFFDENRIKRCQIFANNAASICENAQLVEYMVFALARSAEVNDQATGNHINRVGKICALLAEEMGLDHSFVGSIRVQSTLHDVGKIHTPPELLRKAGHLSSEEYDLVKHHTIYGADIIGRHPWLSMARNIAVFHHERWDGSGYPYGLKQGDIPLECRIISLADQYDALRSTRPYKESLDHETACRILLEGDGRTEPSHFDPDVLAAFTRINQLINKIYAERDDTDSDVYLDGEIIITEDLKTGIAEIDEQHTQIAIFLNRLNEIQDSQNLDDGNSGMMEFIDDYVRGHFSLEEHYMILYKYPLMQSHIMAHRNFSSDFSIMKKQFYMSAFDSYSRKQVKNRLSRWIVDHIKNDDRTLADYLKTFRVVSSDSVTDPAVQTQFLKNGAEQTG